MFVRRVSHGIMGLTAAHDKLWNYLKLTFNLSGNIGLVSHLKFITGNVQ